MGKILIIVESPAKCNKIQGYLGSNYIVKASVGHFRDLERSSLGSNESATLVKPKKLNSAFVIYSMIPLSPYQT